MSYEVDNEQYVALSLGPSVSAFKLKGSTQQAAAPRAVPAGRGGGPARAEETTEIETGTIVQSADRGVGRRVALDEHAFNPLRARVPIKTWIYFTNNGSDTHTVVASDGSFSVGPLKAGESTAVQFQTPGTTVRYFCKEHPWAIGEIQIVAEQK